MTKRYSYFKSKITGLFVISDEKHRETFSGMEDEYNCSRIVNRLNTLTEENEQLKSENNMLKVTIGRNEAYIKRLTEISEWHC